MTNWGKNTELSPYPMYKDTGSTRLGKLPAHWEHIELGRTGEFSKGAGGTKEDEVPEGLPCVRYGDLYTYHKYFIKETRSFISPQQSVEYTPIKKGDILFATSDVTPRNVGKSAVNLIEPPVYCGPDLIILRPTRPINPRFAGYLLDSPDAQAQKSQMQRGVTIMHIYANQLKYLSLGLPPIEEQTAIVRFLDHTDEQIQCYIAGKERLIALLEEQRQALVHQAVTRGLDPSVRLKPSGVEWLGDVPEHWDILEIKKISQIQRGKFTHRPRNDPSLYDGPYPFIQTGDIAGATKMITGFKQTLNQQGLAISTIFPAGTLVMTIAANIGDVAILNFDACFPDSVVGFIPQKNVHRDQLYYLFRAMKNEFLREAPVNTQGNLNVERIASIKVALPPLQEQAATVEHLDNITEATDDTIRRADGQIRLIEEYRTRLIADVVTGQLDVREAAAQLPAAP